MSDPLPLIKGEEVLRVRNKLHNTIVELRNERNFLNEHCFKVEASVKHAIIEKLELSMFQLERLLDAAKIPYTYK